MAAILCAARAQSPQTVKAFETEAHVGPVEKALVGVELSRLAQNGNRVVRHGNGIVIRCDGFVLTAQALFGEVVNSAGQNVTVILYPGTSEARRVSARVVGAANMARRAFAGKPEPLVVLKLADVHTPALRLLLPDALSEEKQATLAWSAWDETSGKFLPLQKRALALSNPTRQVPSSGNRLLFAQGEAVPLPGAVVIGPEGMGIGLTTTIAASAPDAASFATLNSLTNCVTPQSATDAQFASLRRQATEGEETQTQTKGGAETAAANTEGTNMGGMRRILGGIVRLNALLQQYQPDMARLHTACVAPFLIDRYEVTNAQYWKFWQALSHEDRQNRKAELYPLSWADNPAPFPKELDTVPVLGVPLAGAQAYATWAGKRLPTPYEWCLAAFGPNGGTTMPDWVNRYVADRQETWNRIVTAHSEYARQNPDVFNTGMENGANGIAAQTLLPWLFWYSFEAQHTRWSHDTIMRLTAHLWKDWNDPQHILPVGSRKFDVSPYGVSDMIFNGAEMVMPGQLWPGVENGQSADGYIQVGFPNLSPDELAKLGDIRQYAPRAVRLEPTPRFVVLPEPLLSRRLRGPVTLNTTDGGIYAEYMNVSANLRKVSDMMAPVGEGVVGIAPGPQRLWPDYGYLTPAYREENAADARQRYGPGFAPEPFHDNAGKIHISFEDAAWYALWKTTVLPTHREMGRDVTTMPVAAPPLAREQDPTLSTYLVPGGFRCVR